MWACNLGHRSNRPCPSRPGTQWPNPHLAPAAKAEKCMTFSENLKGYCHLLHGRLSAETPRSDHQSVTRSPHTRQVAVARHGNPSRLFLTEGPPSSGSRSFRRTPWLPKTGDREPEEGRKEEGAMGAPSACCLEAEVWRLPPGPESVMKTCGLPVLMARLREGKREGLNFSGARVHLHSARRQDCHQLSRLETLCSVPQTMPWLSPSRPAERIQSP